MNRVGDKIDRLIRAEIEAHQPQLISFFEQVHSNYAEAIRTASRLFIIMLTAWIVTYGIHRGWIDKIELFGVDLDRELIVVSPFLVGVLTYGLLSALAGAIVLWEAASRGVYNMLRTAWNDSLDDLLAPPTFSNVERMLEPSPKNKLLSLFSRAWFVIVTLLMFGGSIAALGHTTYLFFNPRPDIPVTFGVVSALLGAIAWLRGVVLFAAAIKATGGFNLGHHRGSGRVGVGEG